MLTILFMIIFFTTIRIESAYEIKSAFLAQIQGLPFNGRGDTYENIYSKNTLEAFLRTNIIQYSYNETIKYYSDGDSTVHNITEFNRLMGIRMTYQRAKLQLNDQNHLKDIVLKHRIQNYQGRTGKKL